MYFKDNRLTFALFGMVSIGIMIYNYYSWTGIINNNTPQINTITQAQLNFTNAHLWFEEHISGDSTIDIQEDFWENIHDFSDKINNLQKSKNGHGSSVINSINSNLELFSALAIKRLENAESSGTGSTLDQEFDDVYREIINSVTAIEAHLNDNLSTGIKQQSDRFAVLLILWIVGILFGTWFLRQTFRKRIELEEHIVAEKDKADVVDKSLYELEKLKSAMDEHSLVSRTDLEGTIIYVNDKFCKVSGYTKEELVGQNHRILNSGKAHSDYWKGMFKLCSTGVPWHGEVCNLTKGGDYYWVDTTIVPTMDVNDIITGYVSIRTDISARVIAERKSKYITDVLDKSKNEVYMFDGDTLKFIEVNNAVTSNTGYKLKELQQMTPMDIDTEMGLEEFKEMAAPLKLDHSKVQAFETSIRRKDGTIYNVDINLQHLPGERNIFLAVAVDITDRVHAIEDSRQSELKFGAMFEKAPLGVAMVNSITGEITEVNPQFCKILGRTEEELSTIHWEDMTHPDDIQEDLDYMDRFNKYEISGYKMEKRFIRPDGVHVPVSMTITHMDMDVDGVESIHLCMIDDISESKRTQNELIQSQKMQSIGQLTGGIAHDFNNVLGSMLGFTQLIQMKLDEDEIDKNRVHKYLNNITESGNRAKELISHMMSYSRNTLENKTEYKLYDLTTLVNDSLELLSSALPSSMVITTNVSTKAQIKTNNIKLHQLMMNLCINARDAMGGVGSVVIGVRSYDSSVTCSSCHNRVSGKWTELYVMDTGNGIPHSKLDNIFEPFYTTKEVGKGTGMGLSIVHGIMHDHGGHILVNTDKNGTTFSLLFPRVSAREEDVNLHVQDEYEATPGGGKQVLIVDDEIMIGQFVSELLEDTGYETVYEMNSNAALTYYRQNWKEIDIVITDQTMPGLTGTELVRHMISINPDVKVVICSGNTDAVNRNGLTSGCAVLPKPLDFSKFFQEIDGLIN